MTDTLHRNVDVDDVESTPTTSPTPGEHRPRRGRWIAGAVAVAALAAGAVVAFLVVRDDDPTPTPTPTPTQTTSATTGDGPDVALPAEQRQAIPPAMREALDERQVLREAAERAQIAEWARDNDLTGLSPASVRGSNVPQ